MTPPPAPADGVAPPDLLVLEVWVPWTGAAGDLSCEKFKGGVWQVGVIEVLRASRTRCITHCAMCTAMHALCHAYVRVHACGLRFDF